MKAIIDSANTAFYLFDEKQEFVLGDDALVINNRIDKSITSKTHKVVSVAPLNGVFVGGAMAVDNGALVVSDPSIYETVSAEITAELLRAEEERANEAQRELANAINRECQDRIFAVASSNAQMNMAAHAAAGLLTAEQDVVFKAGLKWIKDSQDVARQLIANQSEDYRSDDYWPTPTQDMIDLAEQF